MNKKCKFVKHYFDGKDLNGLKKSIRPINAWDDIEKDSRIWIKDLDIPKKTETMLEIGSGIGRLLKPLSEKYICYGIDASKGMVENAQEYAPKAKVVLCDGKGSIDFPANLFDFVFSLIVFQHIEDTQVIKKYINNSFSILQKGGTGRFQFLRTRPDVEYKLKTYHDHDEIMKFIGEVGYKNISKRDSLYNWTMISGEK